MRQLLAKSRERLKGIIGLHDRSDSAIGKEEIAAYLSDSPTVVEAGAHLGVDTFEMAKLWPHGQIHAFEPIPHLFEPLCARARSHPNVKCYPLALSDKNGTQDIFVSSGASDASSSLRAPKQHLRDHPKVRFKDRLNVETVTLDQWATEHAVKTIDFLWLDVQGHELSVLKSSLPILETTTAIYLEVNLKEVYEDIPLYPEVKDWLEGQGFEVVKEQLPPGWDGGNVLFVRQR